MYMHTILLLRLLIKAFWVLIKALKGLLATLATTATNWCPEDGSERLNANIYKQVQLLRNLLTL